MFGEAEVRINGGGVQLIVCKLLGGFLHVRGVNANMDLDEGRDLRGSAHPRAR